MTDKTSPASGQIRSPRPPATGPTQRILVVEDDQLIRRLNAELLTSEGYQVDTAVDGADAWDAVQLKAYDLLVTDNEMPRVTGVELIKKLQGARLPLPVVMATGTMPQEELNRFYWLQPAAVLLKPYTFDELVGTVREVLRAQAGHGGAIVSRPDCLCQPPSFEVRL